MNRLFVCFLVGFLASCASVNNSLTPSVKVIKDDFDGSVIVRQAPVSASKSMGEGWHTLGFEWVDQHPNMVYITAGVPGIRNVQDVEFNADGQIISNIRTASSLTSYDDWSTRRFVITWEEFMTIANAKSVKMKVVGIDDYTVSSFGPENAGAVVNMKIGPFVQAVSDARAGTRK